MPVWHLINGILRQFFLFFILINVSFNVKLVVKEENILFHEFNNYLTNLNEYFKYTHAVVLKVKSFPHIFLHIFHKTTWEHENSCSIIKFRNNRKNFFNFTSNRMEIILNPDLFFPLLMWFFFLCTRGR